MIPLLLLAVAAPTAGAASLPVRSAASASATISVRILQGARVRLGESSDDHSATIHPATVRVDGAFHPARLVEFQ